MFDAVVNKLFNNVLFSRNIGISKALGPTSLQRLAALTINVHLQPRAVSVRYTLALPLVHLQAVGVMVVGALNNLAAQFNRHLVHIGRQYRFQLHL